MEELIPPLSWPPASPAEKTHPAAVISDLPESAAVLPGRPYPGPCWSLQGEEGKPWACHQTTGWAMGLGQVTKLLCASGFSGA